MRMKVNCFKNRGTGNSPIFSNMEKESFKEVQDGLFTDDKAVLYNYTAVNGLCFSVMAETLEMCRKQRDKWINERSVAFTGHRFILFSEKSRLRMALVEIITECYHNGSRFFLSGMALGFDIIAAECVLELKNTFSDISLIAVIPFKNQSIRFNDTDKATYDYILCKADKIVVLSDVYFSACYLSRNDYLIKNSSAIIAYYDTLRKGGTAYTIHKAEKRRIPIYNLFQE